MNAEAPHPEGEPVEPPEFTDIVQQELRAIIPFTARINRAWLQLGGMVFMFVRGIARIFTPPLALGSMAYQVVMLGVRSLSIATLGGTRLMYYVGFEKWTQQGNYVLATNSKLGVATYDENQGEWVKDDDPLPLNLTETGDVSGVEALRVGNRIHLWITDSYEIEGEPTQAIGYFLYDPDFAAEEDAAAE